MAEGVIGRNLTFPIKNANGTSFHGLSLKKATYNTVVMSLGDKITGDVYYQDNTLAVTMQEYIEYTDNGTTVKFYLVNPPTIVKERMVSDNGELKGMTKYSFEFYHPMYMLGNFPFTDVAVTSNQKKYLSENKTFSWIGTLVDFVAKINKNLQGTQWKVVIGSSVSSEDKNKLSEVMSFDKQTIADALKKGYETWEIPYVVDVVKYGEDGYSSGKRFKVQFGLPTTEILVQDGQGNQVPYVFRCGQGVGLKNNSRTPRNNKIVTRIAGYGSETNIQYGYPQIIWTGNQSWDYTINNSSSATNSYPIYDGIVNGQKVRLIKHPFTRNHLMPSIYRDTVNNKVNPYATEYDPTTEIKDYYDADGQYQNPIVPESPSYEIHEFASIKPELGDNKQLMHVEPAAQQESSKNYYGSIASFVSWLSKLATQTNISVERAVLHEMCERIQTDSSWSDENDDAQYWFKASFVKDSSYAYVNYESSNINFTSTVLFSSSSVDWNDNMDDDGNYIQSYFKVSIPQLDFDLYACAAVTQEMKIYMRSGDCLGCTFPVMVDWDDYKKNFYDDEGNFDPVIGEGHPRDGVKYPNSQTSQITLLLQKENETFGTLMPNIYQQPESGDKFTILGIALPQSYVTSAENRLDIDMRQYMHDNNIYYFDYPLKFDEYFLAAHTDILSQMKNNVIVRFSYGENTYALYIKQMTIKYGQSPLPQYDITLTDDVEIVLNQIGQVTNEVSNLRLLLGGGYGEGGGSDGDERYLRKDVDDTASGFITLLKGLQVGERFVTGLLGEGGVFRTEADGTTYLECDKLYVRIKAYFDTVEVRKYMHSGGNRIASPAGINCARVEYINSSGVVTNDVDEAKAFKCYFKARDDAKSITNDFIVGDLAYCKETNVDTTSINQHGYWRLVTGKSSSPNSDNEHWILLSNKTSETITISGTQYTHSGYLSGSDAPIAGDDIIQLGNIADNTRQGAIVEFVTGADAPSYQIFQGINTFSTSDKNYVRFGYDSASGGAQAYIGNPDGSTYLWYHRENNTPQLDIKANVKFTSPDPEYGTSDLNHFIDAVTRDVSNIHSQIDGEIDTWFYEGTPTLNNAPANEWTTATEKERHLGDLYYDIGTGATGGFAYRFIKDENNVYQWQYLEDTAITEALAKAAEAYDLADHKRRVFYTTPTPPYDNGDLWVNAVWPASGASQGETYNDDILRCVTSKSATGTFSISDWTLASNYTDDSALIDFVTNTYARDLENIETQIDGKAETWYQDSDPSTAWTDTDTKVAHVGDIWYDTSANGGKKTYIWRDRGEGQSNRFYWAEQAVPDDVFDEIDGKAAVYVAWNAWMVDGVSQLNVKDLFIPSSDTTQGGVAYKANKVYRCINASTPTFQEIRYTDDTTVDYIINSYGNILGISSPTAQNVGEALGFLRQVLGGSTSVDGGLVLTNLIAMKDAASTPNIWGGISGMYKTAETGTTWKGHGIAAWYGGAMVDKECISPTPSESSWNTYKWARSLFRFDGSGYVAGGNLTWDKNGQVTLQGVTVNATTLQKNGSDVATESMLAQYLPLSAGSDKPLTGTLYSQTILPKTNNTYNLGGTSNYWKYLYTNRIYLASDVYLEYNSTSGSQGVHLVGAGFYSDSFVSAFGIGTGGGGGTVSLCAPLDNINNNITQLPASNLDGVTFVWNKATSKFVYSSASGAKLSVNGGITAGAASSINGKLSVTGYVEVNGGGFVKSDLPNGDNYVLLAGGGTKLLSEIGGGGSVTAVKVGDTTYSPSSGVVSLPAYLPLTGGTLTLSSETGLSIKRSSNSNSLIAFYNVKSSTDTLLGYLGFSSTVDNPVFRSSGGTNYKLWHEGNFTPSDYALASSVYSKTEANDKFLYSSSKNSFTPNDIGWYRIGYVGRTTMFDFNIWLTNNYGQGHYKYVGSSYASSSWRITELYGQYSSSYIPKIRLVYNSSDTRVYIEVYYGYSSANREVNFKFFYGSPSDTVTKTADTPADANERVIKEFTGSSTSDGHVVTDTDLEDYVTTSALTTTLSGYVTLAGNETISGEKIFTQNVTVQKSGASATKVIAKNDNGTISLYRDSANRGIYDDTLSSWIIYTDGTNTIIPVGNIGIGVTSPTSKLHVNGETKTNNLAISSTSPEAHLSFARSTHNYITSAGNIRFVTGGKENVGTAYTDLLIDNGAVSVTGTFAASGNSTIGGTLGVTGAATLSSTLTVAGTTTLQDHVYISNNKYIYYRDKDDTSYKDVFRFSSNNRLLIGYGIRTLADSYTSIYAGASGMKFFTNGTTERMIITASGLVGIGSTDETNFITEKLSVNGNIKTATSDGTYIQIGGARIVWDNTNKALKVIQSDNLNAANLYATGAVSAFGINSSSGGLSLCTPLNNINNNINQNPTVNGATFVWNGNTSKFVYSNTSGQTLYAYNISVSSALSAYTGSFGSTLQAAAMTVTGGNLTVQTGNLVVSAGRAGIAGSTSSSYTLYVHGNIRSNYLAIGATEDVNSLSCATIKTLSSKGLSVQTSGNAACYTNVAWSVSSDMRLKHIVSNAGASIEQIADAPIFNFRWLSGGSDTILGSSAQYWQTVFPCAVRGDMNSFLSMDYGGIALAAAVITARKVVKHEDDIAKLKRRVKELEDELNELKAA